MTKHTFQFQEKTPEQIKSFTLGASLGIGIGSLLLIKPIVGAIGMSSALTWVSSLALAGTAGYVGGKKVGQLYQDWNVVYGTERIVAYNRDLETKTVEFPEFLVNFLKKRKEKQQTTNLSEINFNDLSEEEQVAVTKAIMELKAKTQTA